MKGKYPKQLRTMLALLEKKTERKSKGTTEWIYLGLFVYNELSWDSSCLRNCSKLLSSPWYCFIQIQRKKGFSVPRKRTKQHFFLTLSSILTVKLADANAVKFKLTNELLKKAKRGKWDWNKLHLQMKCYKSYYFKVVFLYIFSISLPIFL